MIGYVWAVYPASSSNPMIATGITDDEKKARKLVASYLRNDATSIIGFMQPVSLSAEHLRTDGSLVADWPPAGNAKMARRNSKGGVTWTLRYPGPWD